MRKSVVFVVSVAVACSLAACSSSEDKPPFAPAAPVLLDVRGNVGVGQHVSLGGDETNAYAPGTANMWDLGADLSLRDGWDDQFDTALSLRVGTLATTPPTYASVETESSGLTAFPSNQLYDELTFYGPLARASDGAVTAVVAGADAAAFYRAPLGGASSAWLLATSDSRLSQAVALPAVADGATLTLSWQDAVATDYGNMGTGYQAYYRVAVRAPNGDLLGWALAATGSAAGAHSFDLTPWAGQAVAVSFEYRSNVDWGLYALVDDVSVEDSRAPGTNLLANGDFETGTLAGWTASDAGEPTGVGSGVRTVGQLEVQRFFYAVPGNRWARWADVYTNAGAAAVTTDVVTRSNLGSDYCGFIYDTPGAGGKAITEWDTDASDRDVGFAFGDAQALWVSDTGLGDCAGNDYVYFVKHVTVPPGGSVVLVHFIVMTGTDTGLAATDLTARAAEVDAELAAIVSGIWRDSRYLSGMTAEQIAAVANW